MMNVSIRLTARHYLALAILVVLTLVYGLVLREHLELDEFDAWRGALNRWVGDHVVFSAALVFACGVAATSTPLPLAGIFAVGAGFLFGTGAGLAVALPASAAGATLGMLTARYFFGPQLRASLHRRFEAVFRLIDENGAIMVFSLRMVPIVPFFVINAVTGLTRVRALPFVAVTAIGMLPVTALLVFAGARIADLGESGGGAVLPLSSVVWLTAIGLSFLVLLPIARRRLARTKS